MKTCSKCKLEKPATAEYFSRKASSKDGMRTYCKDCGSAYTRKWNQDNPEHRKAYQQQNAEAIALRKKEYRRENRAQIAEYNRKWLAQNPGYHADWDNNNRDKRRLAVNRYHARRRSTDIGFRISSNISRSIRYSLSNAKVGKQRRRWESLVGYTRDDLKAHIEMQFVEGMSWNNWGDWHIDHITPIISFDIKSPSDDAFKQCWSLSNLQPIWAEENQSKSGKIIYLL